MPTLSNPFGLHSVTPYVIVENAGALITFLTCTFDANVRGESAKRPDGSVQHAEVVIGDSVIMMGEPDGQIGPMPGMFYVYVDDCDASYARALTCGATSVLPPDNYPHGDRYGGVRDSFGNVWWIVTHIGPPSPR